MITNEDLKMISSLIDNKISLLSISFLAKVVAYNDNENKATISPLCRLYNKHSIDSKQLQLPDIFDIPVFMPYWGDFVVKSAIKVGTIVLCLSIHHPIVNFAEWQDNPSTYDEVTRTLNKYDMDQCIAIPLALNLATKEEDMLIGSDNNNIKFDNGKIFINGTYACAREGDPVHIYLTAQEVGQLFVAAANNLPFYTDDDPTVAYSCVYKGSSKVKIG